MMYVISYTIQQYREIKRKILFFETITLLRILFTHYHRFAYTVNLLKTISVDFNFLFVETSIRKILIIIFMGLQSYNFKIRNFKQICRYIIKFVWRSIYLQCILIRIVEIRWQISRKCNILTMPSHLIIILIQIYTCKINIIGQRKYIGY